MDERLKKLGKFLQDLEKEKRVSITDEKNLPLKQGCETIVESLLQAIHEKDPRFEFSFHGTGSSYDGVKVGQADEFDFIAEVKGLSQPGAVTIVKASDPGFVKVEVSAMEMKRKWQDCLVLPHNLLQSTDSEALFPERVAHQLDRMELTETDISNSDCILAPFKMQKVFTTLVNECMASLELPENWEHRGYKKPEYSGCRRHGPAAMLEFDVLREGKTVKVNLDVTVGIAVPLPTNTDQLNLYIFQNVTGHEAMQEKLKNVFQNGPQLHLIPLYSSALVKTRKFENKYAWRISCSVVETLILDSFPDDGPKLCLRMIKALRDKYFSAGKRRIISKRVKEMKKLIQKEEPVQEDKTKVEQTEKVTQKASSDKSDVPQHTEDDASGTSDSDLDLDCALPTYIYVEKIRKIQKKWLDVRNKYHLLSDQKDLIKTEETSDLTKTVTSGEPTTVRYYSSSFSPGEYGETIVMEQRAKEEVFEKLRKTSLKIEREELSEMFSNPDSGEYFGPQAYMSSIEMKTYVLRLLGKHGETSFWSMENIVKHVYDFLRAYHTILLENKMMKNFFFDSMVCAPISEEQQLEALKKFNNLFQDFNKIMEDAGQQK